MKYTREQIEIYFSQDYTPMKNSPSGLLMQKLLARHPGMDFESAREKAREMLAKAAGNVHYRTPRVLNAEQEARRAERFEKLAEARKDSQASRKIGEISSFQCSINDAK